jgi:hypothetical protein
MLGLNPDSANKIFLLQNIRRLPENNPATYALQKRVNISGVKQPGVRKYKHINLMQRLEMVGAMLPFQLMISCHLLDKFIFMFHLEYKFLKTFFPVLLVHIHIKRCWQHCKISFCKIGRI